MIVALFPLKLVDFHDLAFCFNKLTRRHIMFYAMIQMVFKQQVFNVGKTLFDCRSLRNNINAISVIVDHFLKASDLTFNKFEPANNFFLTLFV